jgi:hypothetical protein
MTPDAIFPDGECRVIVMAGSAGLPLVHLVHAHSQGRVIKAKNLGVAIDTAVKLCVIAMTEGHRAGTVHFHKDVASEMTTGAVGQSEGLFSFVTGAARLPPFHLEHGDGRISPCFEKSRVAVLAWQLIGMRGVDKLHVSGGLHGKDDIFDTVAAPACREREGQLAMASPAGLFFFHLGHGYGTLWLGHKDFLVTGGAIVVNEGGLCMQFMAEDHVACIVHVIYDVNDIRCKNLSTEC